MRLLLESNTDFPLCLPEPTERVANAYDAALRISMVRLFLSQLQALTLIDPGYGESDSMDTKMLADFAKRLGTSLYNLRSLKIFGFEAQQLRATWSWFAPSPPCGPVVLVDRCDCCLMES